MKTVLITGSSGLLGGNLCYLFSKSDWMVIGTYNKTSVHIPGVEFIAVSDAVNYEGPLDVIIHCAAKTHVDDCERNPQEAFQTNVDLTGNMVNLANRHKALLIHISTDAVYQDGPGIKSEASPLEPLSVYAKTKAAAEELVIAKAEKYIVVRTNLFGWNIQNKNSLAEWVVNNLKEDKEIHGFEDVYFSPILVNDLFEALIPLIQHYPDTGNIVVNIGSVSGMSKYEFACRLAEIFNLDKNKIIRSSVKKFGFTAPRSENMVMDSSRFTSVVPHSLPTLDEGLQRFKQLYKEGYADTLKSFNH